MYPNVDIENLHSEYFMWQYEMETNRKHIKNQKKNQILKSLIFHEAKLLCSLNSDSNNKNNNNYDDVDNTKADSQMQCTIARSIFNYISLMYSFVS